MPLRNYFEFSGYLYYSWVVVALPLTVIFFLWSIPFLKKLPGTYAYHFVFAGLIYVVGAVGFEMIGADIVSSKPAPTSENYLWVEIILTIEEGLEITGIVYFNQLLTDFFKKLKPL